MSPRAAGGTSRTPPLLAGLLGARGGGGGDSPSSKGKKGKKQKQRGTLAEKLLAKGAEASVAEVAEPAAPAEPATGRAALRNLRKLSLHSNPLALEGFYRESVIFAIPTLEHLDASVVTPRERQEAVHLFTAKRIEKKYAFGTIPKIWEKPRIIQLGEPSEGELQLRKEIRIATRRRSDAARSAHGSGRVRRRPRGAPPRARGGLGKLLRPGRRAAPRRGDRQRGESGADDGYRCRRDCVLPRSARRGRGRQPRPSPSEEG